jgi:hypothetical protein
MFDFTSLTCMQKILQINISMLQDEPHSLGCKL